MRGLPRLGVLVLGLGLLGLPVLGLRSLVAQAAIAGHVVISEVMIGVNGASTDEFVELYNPTGGAISLDGYSLRRRTAQGTSDIDILDLSGSIPAYGYFLLTQEVSSASDSADMTYEENIALNNRVYLYDGETVVDKVGMGAAEDFETAVTGNPPTNGSIERKASETASQLSMAFGGADEFGGNGWDSDNNALDFVPRAVPGPQNSEVNETPAPTPANEPTVEPMVTPTPTVEPTEEPEPTPTEEPTPTVTPTEEPTGEPTPTEEPTPTVEPTLTPTPTVKPSPRPDQFSFLNVTCTRYQIPFRFFGRTIHFTHIVCGPRWNMWR